ncbi:hypothetical protein [Coraliomargarita parva]|uniref:hypothetical protein n=1 Tax=Coraliomargarita parva TaxID=3014050 RepID=UPI0022B3AD48|nr:hypothetical protein [Coraliomargarita parva]
MNAKTSLLAITSLLGTLSVQAETIAEYTFDSNSVVSTDTSTYSSASAFQTLNGTFTSNEAQVTADITSNSTNPSDPPAYFSFSFTVQNLDAGETLDLTSLTLLFATDSVTADLGVYTDAVGYTGTGDKIGAYTHGNTSSYDLVTVDLTATNSVVASSLTGLTNGETIDFRFTIGDRGNNNASKIYHIDDVNLSGTVSAIPEPGTFALLAGASALLWIAIRKRLS